MPSDQSERFYKTMSAPADAPQPKTKAVGATDKQKGKNGRTPKAESAMPQTPLQKATALNERILTYSSKAHRFYVGLTGIG
eukprot:3604512-Alexandrium_andersonii.AAC.1